MLTTKQINRKQLEEHRCQIKVININEIKLIQVILQTRPESVWLTMSQKKFNFIQRRLYHGP